MCYERIFKQFIVFVSVDLEQSTKASVMVACFVQASSTLFVHSS